MITVEFSNCEKKIKQIILEMQTKGMGRVTCRPFYLEINGAAQEKYE